jgi:hypothetical protein
LREFVTVTVTVPPTGVFGLGSDFAGPGATAAGADSEFCASDGAATTPNSVAAIATVKIRLLINFLPALARA